MRTVARVRACLQRHSALVAVIGAVATTALLVLAVNGRRGEFTAALAGASWPLLALTAGIFDPDH